MARIKKKGESGTATAYLSRKQALRKMQISLKDFRRLCILKGIYPVEPKHKKKANKNNSSNKTYYYVKDIQFLMHEPIIDRFRAFKTFLKKLRKFIGKRDQESSRRLKHTAPTYKLDHIVRERYPTFTDALRDVDDALSMCFLFGSMPKNTLVKAELIHLCKRLTVEFMHYVMETRSLRKVFISIKGFYYQAEIMGQDITWIVPHALGFHRATDIDFKIMVTFTEFYSTVLGFVNYKLYHSLNLLYPPKISEEVSSEEKELCEGENEEDEFVAALNFTLKKLGEESAIEHEENELPELDENTAEQKAKQDEEEKLKNLFGNCKIFLNREIPRESIVFVIRSCGGEVSYDKTICAGATFDETDETITHHIVDRPLVTEQYLSRYYVQPQWVYDCVNSRKLLPVQPYFPGEVLPPHLSPFVKEDEDSYTPAIPFKTKSGAERYSALKDEEEQSSGSEEESEVDEKQERKRKSSSELETPTKKMQVKPGKVRKVDEKREEEKQLAEEKRLAIMMMPKKRKYLYDKIIHGQKRKKREVFKMKEKAEACKREKKKAVK